MSKLSRPTVCLFALAMVASGCERNFKAPEPPPPTVRIESSGPSTGFSGDPVALCATFLDDPAGSNRVFFGAGQAEVIGFEPPPDWQPDDWSCSEQSLWVRVPVLDGEGNVALVVANTTGQSPAEVQFAYRGPGHPVAAQIDKVMHLNGGLWGLFTAPETPSPIFGGISHDAATLSITESSYGLHLDFGLCDMPVSASAAVTDFFVIKFFVTTMSLGAGDTLGIELSLLAWEVDLLDLVLSYTFSPPEDLPLPSTSDRQAFLPLWAWSYPRFDQPIPGATLHDVAISHALRPALMLVPATDPDQAVVVEWPDQAPHCASDPGERLGPIADLVFDPQTRDFYVAFSGSNEIWRLAAESHVLDRVWPPPVTAGYEDQINCATQYTALALRRSHANHDHLRLYAADGARIREFKVASTVQGEVLEPTLNVINLDALTFALTTGLYHGRSDAGVAMTGERLYALTQNGITILDVSAVRPSTPNIQRWFRVGELPLPSNRGGPQSLVTNHTYAALGEENDIILAADAAGDVVQQVRVGAEDLLLGDVTIGASVPSLVGSVKRDRLYVSDALSNSIHVIATDAGLRSGQFPIASLSDHAYMGFGTTGLASLRWDDADLLVAPLLDFDPTERKGRILHRLLAFEHIDKDLPACGVHDTGLQVDDSMLERFDDMHLVAWDLFGRTEVPLLVLNRLHDEVDLVDANGQTVGQRTYAARTWCQEIDPGGQTQPLVLASDPPLCDLSEDEVAGAIRLVRVARDKPAIARLTSRRDAAGSLALALHLTTLPGAADEVRRDQTLALEPELDAFLTDMLVTSSLPGEPPATRVYLPLATLGRIGVATFPQDGSPSFSYLNTGGEPIGLSRSPDGRRLYASHAFLSRLDIIRLDCGEQKCKDQLRTLDVGPWPHQILFTDTGRTAYLSHLFSHDITVVE